MKYYLAMITQFLSRLVAQPTDVDTDVMKIRNCAPFHNLILGAEEPVRVSPGVYVFNGVTIGETRVRRYRAWLDDKSAHIELWK